MNNQKEDILAAIFLPVKLILNNNKTNHLLNDYLRLSEKDSDSISHYPYFVIFFYLQELLHLKLILFIAYNIIDYQT